MKNRFQEMVVSALTLLSLPRVCSHFSAEATTSHLCGRSPVLPHLCGWPWPSLWPSGATMLPSCVLIAYKGTYHMVVKLFTYYLIIVCLSKYGRFRSNTTWNSFQSDKKPFYIAKMGSKSLECKDQLNNGSLGSFQVFSLWPLQPSSQPSQR